MPTRKKPDDTKRGNGEGSIYQEGARKAQRDGVPCTGRWLAQVIVDGSKRRSFHKTPAQAKAGLRVLLHDAADGAVSEGNVTVGDVVRRWERRTLAGLDIAPSTRDTYSWCLDRIVDELGSRRLAKLTVDDVENALDRMTAGDKDHRPLGRASLTKVRTILTRALDDAVRRRQVQRNVAKLAALTPEAKRTEPRKALTAEEAKRLLEVVAGDRLEAYYTLLLTTGLRPGEAAGLCWPDVDLDAGRISVRSGVRMEHGRATLVDALKTPRSRRTIDLPQRTVDSLKRHRTRQAAERLAASSWADDRLVFTTRAGTPMDPAKVRTKLAKLCTDNDLPAVLPNELRHSAASLLSAAGVPLEHVADLLGHTSTRMLEMTYRHSVQPSIAAAVAPMDALLG